MNLIHHNPLQSLENTWCIFVTQQQGEAFGGGQEDMGRVGALAAALGVGGVAGAVLDANGQARALNRAAQVAADVGGQRLERRDVEGVQAGNRII